MDNNTMSTMAALRTRSEASFVPAAAQPFWQLPISTTGNATGVFGFGFATSTHDAAKQDRPPRGVPR